MRKIVISKLFMYRHRFFIGYFLLSLVFLSMLFIFPLVSPNGLSDEEMASSTTSFYLDKDSITNGNIVDLPYHILQKVSISLFGLTVYGIKLPSIILGLFLSILLVLLLNRWFKNNTAIIAAILTVLSSSFLYIAGSGTPLIMTVFWPTLLLWLGSKIQGENKPKPFYSFIFAIVLFLSLFTPYMVYMAGFICLYVLLHPHLRFTVRNLPKVPLFAVGLIIVSSCVALIISAIRSSDIFKDLLFMDDFSWSAYLLNIKNAFLPFFQWSGTVESNFLAPLVGLATISIAITGLISTAHGFFASRNSIASLFIVFTIIISGLNPNSAVLILLPLAILIAHGMKYILNQWYGLFPENPYARIFGFVPIAVFMTIIVLADFQHFIFGYRYNPAVANEFSEDLSLIRENIKDGDTIVAESDLDYNFYKIIMDDKPLLLGGLGDITVFQNVPETANSRLITLGHLSEQNLNNFKLDRVITNSKSSSSDRLYIYDIIIQNNEE